MSVKFLSDEWAETLTKACNANAAFAKATKGQQATIVVNVNGSPAAAAFTMVYDDGTVTVSTGAGAEADVKLDLEYPTMVELSKGTTNGPAAIAGGKMTAEGDMGKMFGLGKAMALLPTIEADLGLEY